MPWWIGTLAQSLAVLLSVWCGLHARFGAEWLVLWGVAAATSAVLPIGKITGAIGLLVGAAVAVGGAYLMRDARGAVSIGDLVSPHGGIVSPTREAAVLVLTACWLLGASAFRLLRHED